MSLLYHNVYLYVCDHLIIVPNSHLLHWLLYIYICISSKWDFCFNFSLRWKIFEQLLRLKICVFFLLLDHTELCLQFHRGSLRNYSWCSGDHLGCPCTRQVCYPLYCLSHHKIFFSYYSSLNELITALFLCSMAQLLYVFTKKTITHILNHIKVLHLLLFLFRFIFDFFELDPVMLRAYPSGVLREHSWLCSGLHMGFHI